MRRCSILSVLLVCFFSTSAQENEKVFPVTGKSTQFHFDSLKKSNAAITGKTDAVNFDSRKSVQLVSALSEKISFDFNTENEKAVQKTIKPIEDSKSLLDRDIDSSPSIILKNETSSDNTDLKNEASIIENPRSDKAVVIKNNAADKEMVSHTSVDLSNELGSDYKGKIPTYYALIIGVSNYRFSGPGLPSLENPLKDIERLYNTLTVHYQFPIQNTMVMKDPTRQQIIDQLEDLSNKVDAEDNFLLFFAGHGFYDHTKEFGYWLPSDARLSSRSEWIANSTIKDYLSAIRSKHTLLISDACFSGSLFKTRSIDGNMISRIANLYKYPSRRAITSGNLDLVPDKSVFMDYLVKRLIDNEDSYLPSQNLYTRIYEPVSNNSSTLPQFGVIQGTGDEGGDFIFIKKN